VNWQTVCGSLCAGAVFIAAYIGYRFYAGWIAGSRERHEKFWN